MSLLLLPSLRITEQRFGNAESPNRIKSPSGESSGGGGGLTLALRNTHLSPRYKIPRSISPKAVADGQPQLPRFDLSPREPVGGAPLRGSPHKKFTLVAQQSQSFDENRHSSSAVKGIHQRGELGHNSSLQTLPFSLIQIHRDSFKMKTAKDMRRNMKCYLRLCGSLSNGNDAKIIAEAQMTLCEIKLKRSTKTTAADEDTHASPSANRLPKAQNVLEWKRFTGYENMPLQHTDHFLILCRSVPVEYCSFTPDCDLLELIFPPSCKLKGQKYSCVSVNDLKRQQVSSTAQANATAGNANTASVNANANAAKSDLLETLTPLYTREISCVSEIHAVTHTKIESLRYAVIALPNSLENQATPNSNTSLLVIPMYSWHPISEELISAFSCADYSNSVKADADQRRAHKFIDDPDKVFLSSKAATDELKIALQGFGVGASQHRIGGNRGVDDDHSISGDAQGMLLRDLQIRSAVDEANKRYLAMQNLRGARNEVLSAAGAKERNRKGTHEQQGQGQGQQPEKTIAEIEREKKEAVRALIAARSRVLALNDELCQHERGGGKGGGSDASSVGHGAGAGAGPALGRKRVELFDALQSAPSLKSISKLQSADRQAAKLSRQGTGGSQLRGGDYRNGSHKKGSGGGNLPPLRQKLEVLDDSLFHSVTAGSASATLS
jgi:hypothetical protein